MTDKIFVKKLNKMSSQLRQLAEPDSRWVENSRTFLMSQIINEKINQDNKIPFWLRMADSLMPQNLVLKPVAVFSLVLGLFLISSFATVNASKNTLPGDPLYNVKINAEKVRYILSVSQEQKAKMSLEVVRKRAEEFKILTANLDDDNTEKQLSVQQVSFQIKSELDNVKNKLIKIDEKEKDNSKVVEVAIEITNTINQIEQQIPSDGNLDSELKNNIDNLLAKAKDVKMAALAVIEESGKASNENSSDNEDNNEYIKETSSSTDDIIETTDLLISTSTATVAPSQIQTEEVVEWELESEKLDVVEEEFEVRINN